MPRKASTKTKATATTATPGGIPLKFTDFVAVCGIGLTPGQEALCRVAYDGDNPKGLPHALQDVGREIFGEVREIRDDARRTLVAVCGRRAGKTLVLVALRLVHLALTVNLDRLGPGERAAALIVAPDLRLARQALRYAQGVAESTPAIAAHVVPGAKGGTGVPDGFIIERENGQQVAIECLPATRGGSAVRGRSIVAAALDEAAFFRDENAVINDAEVYRALPPCLLPGGQIIIASSPWEEAGLLFSLFRENRTESRSAIAAHAPTTLLRPDADTAAMVAIERRRDPDNADREFDAVFMSGIANAFFPPAALEAAIDTGRTGALPRHPEAQVEAGADFAFRSDSSALVVAQRLGDVVHVSDPIELRPETDKPLRPSEVVKRFAAELKPYGAESVLCDSHYIEAVRENLEPYGIAAVTCPEGQEGKQVTYLATRRALLEGRVRLPDNPRLIAQLKAVTSRPTPGGGLTITSPRMSGGGHGDLASALVLAVWRCAGVSVSYSAQRVPSQWAPVSSQTRGHRPQFLDRPDHSDDLDS